MRKLFFVGLFFGLFPLPSHALPLAGWQHATVEVSSFPCLTERPRFSGSGLLVSSRDAIWVLTSEHVVIQDKSSSTCHELQSSIGQAKLDFIVADYQKGLALLKVQNPSEMVRRSAVSVEDLQGDAAIQAPSTLVALGFPSGSHQLQTLSEGKLITTESRRALIAGVPSMIEAANLPVEYGMSGGLLVGTEAEGGRFLGLLSHQVLRRDVGKPSGAGDVNPGDAGNLTDLALAIPGNTAISWLLDQMKGSEGLVWQRNPQAQIENQEVVQYGPLLFALKQKNAKDVWEIGGADGSGIGGGDGSGIGGGDQPGQGNSPGEDLLTVEISLNPAADPTLRTKPLQDPKLDLWRTWLLSGRKVEAAFLKNPEAKRLMKIGSLAQFFTFWIRDAYAPVAVRSKVGDMHSDGEQLIRLASAVASLAQINRDQSLSAGKKSWFGMVRDYAVMCESGLASSQEMLGILQGENDAYWRQFYDENFDAAVALEASIQSLVQQMKKMGI